MSNCFWNLSCALVLWRGELSGKRGSVIFGGQVFKDTKSGSVDLLKFVTPCTICHSRTALYARMRLGPSELKNSP